MNASTEGVGLLYSANSFTGNIFDMGASGDALNYYGSASAADLTASGNTVNIAGGGVQGAVDLAGTDGALNLAAGSYTLPGELKIANDGLTLTGAGDGLTILDSNSTGYGIAVDGDNVTLSSFTFNANSGGTYAIKVYPDTGSASDRLLNFAIDHVTINGSHKTGLDLNGVNGATIDYVNVNNTSAGNGITLTDSANVTITNSTTTGNAWGGLALYQSNVYYNQQETGITVDGTNTFNEANGIYAQDQSSTKDFGTINLTGQGIQYVAKLTTPTASGDGTYTFFQKTKQGAYDLADAFNTRYGVTGAAVQGYDQSTHGVAGNNIFYVGAATGGDVLSVNAAVANAVSGGTINVDSGSYAEDVTDNKQLAFDFGDVTLNSLALTAGADGSSLTGNLTTSGDITSAVSATLDGTFTAAAIDLGGAVTLTGDTTLDTSASDGDVTLGLAGRRRQ